MYSYSDAHKHVTMTVEADDALLAVIAASAPRARLGYTPANEKWWKQVRFTTKSGPTGQVATD
jgi:hypothetical protein